MEHSKSVKKNNPEIANLDFEHHGFLRTEQAGTIYVKWYIKSEDINLRYVSLANLVPPNSHTKEPWEWQCWKSLALIALDEDFDRDYVSYWKML